MNYASADPAALLASRRWRVRHSAWLLAPILGVGLLSFIGFVYVGLRVRTRKFWIALAVGCIGSAVTWVVTYDSNDAIEGTQTTGWGSGLTMALWAALIVYGVLINRDYLRWRATQSGAGAWYNQPISPSHHESIQLAPPPGTRAPTSTHVVPLAQPAQGFLGVDRNQFYAPAGVPPASTAPPPGASVAAAFAAPTGAQGGLVDVNSTSAAEIAAALRLEPPLAGHIVAVRQARGGFRDFDDLVAASGLQPHDLVKLRGRVTFGPVQAQAHRSAQVPQPPAVHPSRGDQPGGRILDY